MTHAQDDPPIDGKKCTRLGVNEDKGHMPYASALRPLPQEASQQGGAPLIKKKTRQHFSLSSWAKKVHTSLSYLAYMWPHLDKRASYFSESL